jgi:hypothetical protein
MTVSKAGGRLHPACSSLTHLKREVRRRRRVACVELGNKLRDIFFVVASVASQKSASGFDVEAFFGASSARNSLAC